MANHPREVFIVNLPQIAISGVAINNFPDPFPVSGVVSIANFPPIMISGVAISNFPNPFPVSGVVDVTNFPTSWDIDDMPPVSGTVSVNNFPPVSGTIIVDVPKVGQTQVTADLPASTSAPLEIDCSPNNILSVAGFTYAPWHWTMAENPSGAAVRIAANATRSKLPTGSFNLDIKKTPSLKLYVRSQGVLLAEGITYWFGEE